MPGALLVLGVAIVVTRWLADHAISPLYTPPAGLRAGEAGVVIDGHVHTADVVAAVVDLAVRGYLTLAPAGGDVVVAVARPWLHEKDIRPFETVLLAHVFTDGAHRVRLSELRGRGDAPASIKEMLSLDLTARGLFAEAPRRMRRAGWWLAVIVTAIWTQLAWNAEASLATYAAGLATGAVLSLLATVVARGGHTAEGRRTQRELRGLREYLMRVDKDRLEALPPGTLDERLPWAVALGVTNAWLH